MFLVSPEIILLVFATLTTCETNFEYGIPRAINRFGDILYEELSEQRGNIIFSPLSLHSALSLLTLGARGRTQAELIYHLYLHKVENFRNAYAIILEQRLANLNKSLNIASNVFVANHMRLRKGFKKAARRIFHAIPQEVDFSNPVQAVSIINEWVANKTEDKIRKIMDSTSVNNRTLALLLNAIYFKGKWLQKFDKAKSIKNHIFHSPAGDVHCTMMTMKRKKQIYAFHPKFSMIILEFEDTDIRMAFVKPHVGLSLDEEMINSETFFEALASAVPATIELKIPKFKLQSTFPLKRPLISVGISNVFGKPDLSSLFQHAAHVRVSNVVQKAMIEIDEDGATAAAATVVQIEPRSVPSYTFVFDSPFLFFLYDSTSKIILMRGRIENPAANT